MRDQRSQQEYSSKAEEELTAARDANATTPYKERALQRAQVFATLAIASAIHESSVGQGRTA